MNTPLEDLWPIIVFGYPALVAAIICAAIGVYLRKPSLVLVGSIFSIPPSVYLGMTPLLRYAGFGLPLLQMISAYALHKQRVWLAVFLLLPIIGCTAWLAFLSIM